MSSRLVIKLGLHWSRFCRPMPGLTLLGSVQQDAAIGALARSSAGIYWQLNGDHQRKLNASRVERALRVARGQDPDDERLLPNRSTQAALVRSTPKAAPTVIVKRRRALAMTER